MATELSLQVSASPWDAEEIDRRTRALLTEIREADVDCDTGGSDAPRGSKAGEAITVGALALTLAPTALPRVMDVVASWLSRQPRNIEIEIDGQRLTAPVTTAQRDQLVATYLRRVEGTGVSAGARPSPHR